VLKTRLIDVEGGLHVEDRSTVLNGNDATRGETLSITDAVNFVEDGHVRVTGTKEIRVERVDVPVVNRSASGDQSLGQDLPTKDALPLFVGLDPTEDVDFNGLEI